MDPTISGVDVARRCLQLRLVQAIHLCFVALFGLANSVCTPRGFVRERTA